MTRAFASGAGLALFETLDSTNLEARRRAAGGCRGPLWIVALEQTSGYGRRGSRWVQAIGDFAGTFLFEPKADAARLGEISFVAALAVADALGDAAPNAPLSFKWPNDVLAGGGKLAGILLELLQAPGRGDPLVALGIGVNLVSKPEVSEYPTARLLDFLEDKPPPSPEILAGTLDARFWRRLNRWREEGFAPVRAEWLKNAARLGQKIRVRLPEQTLEGVFADLDSTGALVLDCEAGRRTIAAGAVAP